METRCCVLSSISARIFQLCQMFSHYKRIKQMTPPTWSRDLGTIYKPATKYEPDVVSLVLQVPGPSNFVRSLCVLKESHT